MSLLFKSFYKLNIRVNDIIISKRRIAPMNWPEKTLFPASCNGWLYVVNPKIIKNLLEATSNAPFVFMEDTYVTGILRQEGKQENFMNYFYQK